MEERARRLGGELDDRLGAGRGDDGAARGAACLSRSASSSSTTTRSCARGSAPSSDLQEGIDVVGEAADGVEAVAEARRLAPDVVLMDLVMPRLDGVGAMQQHPRPRARRRA